MSIIRCMLAGCAVAATLWCESYAATPVRVGLWDRFEVTVTNPKKYADPYRDVTLRVRFLGPDGHDVFFWGFYDGGTTWKIRFMPDHVGLWRMGWRG